MNILIFGDYNIGDPDTLPLVAECLSDIDEKFPIDKLVVFNEDGVSYLSTIWAYEENVTFDVYEPEGRFSLNSKNHLPRYFLRKAVSDNDIDAFLFIFLDKKQDKSHHRKKIRYLYRQAKRKFNIPVFVNKEDNLISLF